MNRSERRHFEKEFNKLLKTDSERCSLCHSPFEHNCKTFGGVTSSGRVVITGECCRNRVADIRASGVFVTRHSGAIPEVTGRSSKAVSPEDMHNAVSALQGHFQEIDNLSGKVMKRAGLKNPSHNVFLGEAPWKSDDAAWFKKHPERSHRLRPIFDGELATMPPELQTIEVPEKHRLEIIVRQVEVGTRIRTILCRNIETPIPDVEEIIHALFDSVSDTTRRRIVSVKEVADLAMKYSSGDPSRSN